MASTKVELNSAGVLALLNSAGVRAALTAKAEQVAEAAGDGCTVEQLTTDRAVVRVVDSRPGAIQREAKHGTLARALSSAE